MISLNYRPTPGVQQVIGLGTIIVAIINIWKEHQKIQEGENSLARTNVTKDSSLTTKNVHTRIFATQQNKAKESQEKIEKYYQEIGVGLIRMTPIAGTVYSLYKWIKVL